MNASLTNLSAGGPLSERDPGRLHITRRQIAFAVVLAILGVIAAIYTVNSVTAGTLSFPAVVATSKVYDLNFANTGKVTAILVKVGQRVAAGQVLASQDTTALQGQLAADQTTVKADEATLGQSTAPPLTAAQRGQDALQVQQAQTALTNAQATLGSAAASGKATVAGVEAAVTSAQVLSNSDAARYNQACPIGPIPPASSLTGAQLQTAEALFTHCQDLQLQLDKDLAALTQAQTEVPVALAQAQQAVNSAQATANSAQATLNLAEYQQTLQSSPTNAAAVAQAEANLGQAQGQLAQMQQSIQNANLVAPDTGVVAEIYGAPGEYLGPDGVHMYQAPAPLPANQPSGFSLFPSAPAASGASASVNGVEPVIEVIGGLQQVTAQVPESRVSGLPVGHAASVSISALRLSTTGVVTSVVLNPTRDNTAVTYDVIITLRRTVPGLLPGMSATVRS